VGTQEYELGRARLLQRFADAYGQAAADEIGEHVRPPRP
jgi:adenosine kinase